MLSPGGTRARGTATCACVFLTCVHLRVHAHVFPLQRMCARLRAVPAHVRVRLVEPGDCLANERGGGGGVGSRCLQVLPLHGWHLMHRTAIVTHPGATLTETSLPAHAHGGARALEHTRMRVSSALGGTETGRAARPWGTGTRRACSSLGGTERGRARPVHHRPLGTGTRRARRRPPRSRAGSSAPCRRIATRQPPPAAP